jgi:hypothetical protein
MIEFLKAAKWRRDWKWTFRLQRAVREWLGIGDVLRQQEHYGTTLVDICKIITARAGLILRQQVTDQQEIRALREAVLAQHALNQTQLDQMQRRLLNLDADHKEQCRQDQEDAKVLNAIAELQERVHLLLAPHAERLKARPLQVPSWEQVQQENLKQFKENNDGKSLRR